MCMQLYMSSDIELPTIKYDGTGQELHIVKVKRSGKIAKGLMLQFNKKFLYYIGSFQCCGCGFTYNLQFKNDVMEKGFKSISKLFNYLKENVVLAGEIEIYAYTRSGSSMFEPEIRTTINMSEFELGDSFDFKDDEFITIRK